MPQFIVRIELHVATEDDYVRLHKAMGQVGFLRIIAANDSRNYQLPTAEYNFNGYKTLSEVFSLAEKAADSTGRKSWILVTQSSGCRFSLPLAH